MKLNFPIWHSEMCGSVWRRGNSAIIKLLEQIQHSVNKNYWGVLLLNGFKHLVCPAMYSQRERETDGDYPPARSSIHPSDDRFRNTQHFIPLHLQKFKPLISSYSQPILKQWLTWYNTPKSRLKRKYLTFGRYGRTRLKLLSSSEQVLASIHQV